MRCRRCKFTVIENSGLYAYITFEGILSIFYFLRYINWGRVVANIKHYCGMDMTLGLYFRETNVQVLRRKFLEYT